jgi:hypothetical protein
VLRSIVASLRDNHSLDDVPTAQLMPVLQHAVQLDAAALRSATPPNTRKRTTRASALALQPAFDELKPEQLVALLEVVIEADDEYNYLKLTMHPNVYVMQDGERLAFKQLDAATVASLMMLSVEVGRRGQITDSQHIILSHLWRSQAGQPLREDGCQPGLPVLLAVFSVWPALRGSNEPSPLGYMLSEVAGSIDSTVMVELLTAALQAGNKQVSEDLWWQHASGTLSDVDTAQLQIVASRSGKRMSNFVKRMLR